MTWPKPHPPVLPTRTQRPIGAIICSRCHAAVTDLAADTFTVHVLPCGHAVAQT